MTIDSRSVASRGLKSIKLKLWKLESGAMGLGFDFQKFKHDVGNSDFVLEWLDEVIVSRQGAHS